MATLRPKENLKSVLCFVANHLATPFVDFTGHLAHFDRHDANTLGDGNILDAFRHSKRDFRADLEDAYPRLWRFAFALTGGRDAEDLAQATALRALEKQDLYADGTDLHSWLFTMARRVWFNELRAQKVRRGEGLVPIGSVELPSTAPDAASNIFHAQVLEQVMALPEAQRVTVLLVYVEGYKYAEAADILDVPVGTVMSRLAAARASLVKKLPDESGGGM